LKIRKQKKTKKEMKKKLEEIKHQEIIILNVGGSQFPTTRGTLCAEESLLGLHYRLIMKIYILIGTVTISEQYFSISDIADKVN
jgi:hypothetical protein